MDRIDRQRNVLKVLADRQVATSENYFFSFIAAADSGQLDLAGKIVKLLRNSLDSMASLYVVNQRGNTPLIDMEQQWFGSRLYYAASSVDLEARREHLQDLADCEVYAKAERIGQEF